MASCIQWKCLPFPLVKYLVNCLTEQMWIAPGKLCYALSYSFFKKVTLWKIKVKKEDPATAVCPLCLLFCILLYLIVSSDDPFFFWFPRLSSDIDDLNSPSPMQSDEFWTAPPVMTSEWVICGSALSGHERVIVFPAICIIEVHHNLFKYVICPEIFITSQEILDQFEHRTGITVTNSWSSNVTHVIANTDERGACARTLKVLMAILAGKWVLNVNCKYIFSEVQ